VRTKREKGPKTSKSKTSKNTKTLSSSPVKLSKAKSLEQKKLKPKGETSFIIEEMMDQGIAKGDITMSDGTGTDNMTCVIVQFRDPESVQKEKEEEKNSAED
jgi:hypothetical protein